jgi:hypothetical protein
LIADSTWASAPRVQSTTAPRLGGQPESLTVKGLAAASEYYFALKTADDVPNWSELSNVASTTTLEAPDTIPPAAITTLAVVLPTASTITLTWTAVGDDGCDGMAFSYDIRYSRAFLTEALWSQATVISGSQTPRSCGARESLSVNLPVDTTQYWFGVKTIDEQGQTSPISNVVSVDVALLIADGHWTGRVPILGLEPPWGFINAIEGFSGGVVIGGVFGTLDGVEVNDVAHWSGSMWQPMGSGFAWPPGAGTSLPAPGIVSTTLLDGAVVAGGTTYNYGPHGTYASAPILAQFDGAQWIALGAAEGLFAMIRTAFGWGSDLYYAGRYCTGSFPDTRCFEYVAQLTGGTSESLGEPDDGVLAIVVHNGSVIIGGGFTEIDSLPINRIAMWDGGAWRDMAGGMDGAVTALASDGGRLIAGGDFRTAGGEPAERIAEWTGTSWAPLGSGLGGSSGAFVSALAFHDGDIIAGGRIPEWETRGIRNIARWDGAEWRALGSGTSNDVNDLLSYNGILYVVGAFDSAGGKPANRIATWEE